MIRASLFGGVLLAMPMLLSMSACSAVSSASPSSPETQHQHQSDPEALIVDALRKELDDPLSITVSKKRQSGDWWLMTGSVLSLNGQAYDFSRSPFQSAINNGAFENVFIALLQQNAASQQFGLKALSFGSTDTPVEQWLENEDVPADLFDSVLEPDALQWQ